MARKADEIRIYKAAQLLERRAGYRSGEYARMLGCHREAFNRLLVQLEDRGILFSEDEQGRLWPFGKSRRV